MTLDLGAVAQIENVDQGHLQVLSDLICLGIMNSLWSHRYSDMQIFYLWPQCARGDLELYVFGRYCLGHYSTTINERRFIFGVWHHHDNSYSCAKTNYFADYICNLDPQSKVCVHIFLRALAVNHLKKCFGASSSSISSFLSYIILTYML